MDIRDFLIYLEDVKKYSTLTLKAYETDLKHFVWYCAKIESVDKVQLVNLPLLRRYEEFLLTGRLINKQDESSKECKKIAISSVKRKLSALASFFKFKLKGGDIVSNPMESIIIPKMSKRLPVFATDDVMNELLCDTKEKSIDFATQRDFMIMMLAYYTGLRRAELVSLKINDIDVVNRTLRVIGKGNKERLLPILDFVVMEINSYIEIRSSIIGGNYDHGCFFITNNGNPANEQYIYRHVKKCLTKFTTFDKNSPHVLRHSFATTLLNNGACIKAISELLGHANLAATQVYTHNSFEKLKKVFNQAHPRA